MKAQLEIECKNPDIIIKSIKPDLEKTDKFSIKLKALENKLSATIEAEDMGSLLAGINSYGRLIKSVKSLEDL